MFELFHHAPRAGDFAVQLAAQLHQQSRNVLVAPGVHQNLRQVIRGFGGNRVVIKSRRGAAGENGRAGNVVVPFQNGRDVAADFARLRERRRLGQLHVDEKLVALGRRKELSSKKRHQRKTQRQQAVSDADCAERMFQSGLEQPLVVGQGGRHRLVHRFEKRERADVAAGFETLLAAQQVIAEQRNKGHRNHARRNQRERHHHRQREDECSLVARQQHERQESEDVNGRAEQDRVAELEWPEPGRQVPGLPMRDFAVDGVGGDDGVVHQHPQGNDQSGN